MKYIKAMIMIFCAMTMLAGCARGLTAFSKGQGLEEQGKLDEAVMKYAEASAANPEVAEYRVRFLTASNAAARVHFKKGEDFLALRKYDDSLREFQAAYALDPSLERSSQMVDQVTKIRNSQVYMEQGKDFEKNRKLREALGSYKKAMDFDPGNDEAKEAFDRLMKSRKPKLEGFELNLKSTRPITLKFRDAKVKEVFNILTQLSGINFVFDEGVKDQNVTIMLENATFQQALDILTGINKLSKKVLNESTVILYPKNAEKSKQYEDLRVETFQLNKLDAKKAVNLIRTMLPAKKIYVNEDMNALVMRDTPDSIEIARKILEANDLPDAELVLDVEIIEISKKNENNFGLVLSRYAVQAAASPLDVTPPTLLSDALVTPTASQTVLSSGSSQASSASSNVGNLLKLFQWNRFNGFFTVPSATYNFAKTLSDSQTLANPKIRIKNREKAKFNVGTRLPITTTSSPVGGGVSVNVQYIDVGVKVNAEPTVQLNDDINIKLSLEVSSDLGREKIGDSSSLTTVVTIGTRNLDTVLSLKDGETSIIGGLLQDSKSTSKQTISFLGDIPIIGPLLTGTDKTNGKNELVLAITPHIVRGVTVPDPEVASFWSGKEDDPSPEPPYASFVPEPEFAAAQPAGETPAAVPSAPGPSGPGAQIKPGTPTMPAGNPVSPTPATPAPMNAPVPPSPSAMQGAAPLPVPPVPSAPPPPATAGRGTVITPVMPTVPATPAGPGAAAAPTAAGAPQSAAAPSPLPGVLLTMVAPPTAAINGQFNVAVNVANAANLFGAQLVLTYDPAILDYVGGSEGTFLRSDGKPTTFQAIGAQKTGQVTINAGRVGNVGGANGSGTLASLVFRAKKQGAANLAFAPAHLTDPGGSALSVTPLQAVVNVK